MSIDIWLKVHAKQLEMSIEENGGVQQVSCLFSLSPPLASLVFFPVVAVGPLVRPASTESTETHPALTLLHTSRLGGRIVGYQP